MLTQSDIGKSFKCRVTPYMFEYQYQYTTGLYTYSTCGINAICQKYDASGTVLEDKCHCAIPITTYTTMAKLVDFVKHIVAFDANCIFTHQSVAIPSHPLDTSALPVMLMVEYLGTGIQPQDNRLVLSANTLVSPASSTKVFESKNYSDLTAWGSPKCKVQYTLLGSNGIKFIGSEHSIGPVPAIIEATEAGSGDVAGLSTYLTTKFVDGSYGFMYLKAARIQRDVAQSATTDLTAGNSTDQYISFLEILNGPNYSRPCGGIKNSDHHRNNNVTFLSSSYVSMGASVDDGSGNLVASNVLSMLQTTYDSSGYAYDYSYFGSASGAYTDSANGFVSGMSKQFTLTSSIDSVGKLTDASILPTISSDPEVLEMIGYYVIGHGI